MYSLSIITVVSRLNMKLFSFFVIFQVNSYEILKFDSKPPGSQKWLSVKWFWNFVLEVRFFQWLVIGQTGQIGVIARYFLLIGRVSFQTEREHAYATIAIIIALARISSAKSVRVPMDIAWVRTSGCLA